MMKLHGRTSTCTDPKVKRSNVKVKVKVCLHQLHWLYIVKLT